MLNQDYRADSAAAAVAEGPADAIAFGRPFIANPDLPVRIERGADWAADDPATWYTQGAEGYVDYPALADGEGRLTRRRPRLRKKVPARHRARRDRTGRASGLVRRTSAANRSLTASLSFLSRSSLMLSGQTRFISSRMASSRR